MSDLMFFKNDGSYDLYNSNDINNHRYIGVSLFYKYEDIFKNYFELAFYPGYRLNNQINNIYLINKEFVDYFNSHEFIELDVELKPFFIYFSGGKIIHDFYQMAFYDAFRKNKVVKQIYHDNKDTIDFINKSYSFSLLHGTPSQNTNSIFENGIVPREILDNDTNINGVILDTKRLDGRLNCSSFSISQLNERYFFTKFANDKSLNIDVIKVCPSVIIRNKAYFFGTNAAKSDWFNLKQKLNELYYPNDYNNKIDQQAEIMIEGVIEPKFLEFIGNLHNPYNYYQRF